MQFPSSFPCRFFRQHFLHLGIALLLPLVTAFSLLSAPSPADAEDTKPPREREGGFEVQVPQSPALKAVKIGYIREIGDHPRPASRLDVLPDDAGVAGAKMAVEENNAGGRFTGHDYSVEAATVSSPDEAVEALGKLYESGHNYFVVDASADALLKMSDWAKDKDILLFNVSATDDRLRGDDCRANVFHMAPSRAMLTDALAQFLAFKRWRRLFLIVGPQPGDKLYAEAMKRAARSIRSGSSVNDTSGDSGVRSTSAARSATPPKGSMSSGASSSAPVTRSAIALTVKSRRERSASTSVAKDTSGLRESAA